MITKGYTGCFVVFMVLIAGFTEAVVGCNDSPTVVAVKIVTNASGSWDSDTTPDAVAYGSDVDLRAVIQVSGESHQYYWGYSSSSAPVSGLGATVYRWDGDWEDPSIEWKKVMPDMDGQSTSNDPWCPSYGGYTNVVSGNYGTTASCPHTPSHSYSNPTEGQSIGTAFGISGGHNCSYLRGVYSRKSSSEGAEVDIYDVIVYNHTQVEADDWSYTDSGGTAGSVGTRHYTIVVELDGDTYYSTGKRDSSTVSKLVINGSGGDDDYNIGIRDRVARVARLSNASSTFIKHIESYYLVPWIYGSVSFQARDRIGFDCADLVAAASYNAGLPGATLYTASTDGLESSRTKIKQADEPYYVSGTTVKKSSGANASISIGSDINIGDLIIIDKNYSAPFNGDHTAVLYKDENSDGYLDGNDKIISARKTGVEVENLSAILNSTAHKFVMREGW